MEKMKQSALEIAHELVRRESITPHDGGCLEYIHSSLEPLGFRGEIVTFGETKNLWLEHSWGSDPAKHLCFAGHVDVVPPGAERSWTTPAFSPDIRDGKFYGRGIADMKGPIAVFMAALHAFFREGASECGQSSGTCSLLLTSDEEGDAVDGLVRMIPWLRERKRIPDCFLIGEPTGREPGSVLQVGRRGGLTALLRCFGKQGHVAYPEHIDNPLSRAAACIQTLMEAQLDDEPHPLFQPAHIQVTSVDVGNPVTNVTPEAVDIRFCCRFNPLHTGQTIAERIKALLEPIAGKHSLTFTFNGEPFLTTHAAWITSMKRAIQSVTGKAPQETTRGATTDGRFLIALAPVLEIGFSEETIHQVDEHVPLEHFSLLERIYINLLKEVFSQP